MGGSLDGTSAFDRLTSLKTCTPSQKMHVPGPLEGPGLVLNTMEDLKTCITRPEEIMKVDDVDGMGPKG